jgi:hypothetical protein
VRVTGRLGADTVALDEPITDDEIFGGSALAADVALQRRFVNMAAGDALDLKLAVLELRPAIAIRRLAITARRQPDKQRAGKPVRVFTLGVFGRQTQLELDADGWMVSNGIATRVD